MRRQERVELAGLPRRMAQRPGAWSRLARLMYASSSTSSSNITITRETIGAATTNSSSDRHLRSTRTPALRGGSASADFSASTTERPHEGAADYLHLTRPTGRATWARFWPGGQPEYGMSDEPFCRDIRTQTKGIMK